MGTAGIDHLAMPTANAEALIAFYKKLGFEINDEAEWRAGEANIFSIQAGDSKINVHPEGYTASLRGDTAVPGSADICFVWDGTTEECQKMLNDAGVDDLYLGRANDKKGRGRNEYRALFLFIHKYEEPSRMTPPPEQERYPQS